MTDYYLSPVDIQRISDTVERVLGMPLDYASRVALENALIADTSEFIENVQDVIGDSVIGSGGASTSYDDTTGKTTVTLDADLTAIATLVTLGLIVRTADGAMATRSIIAPAAGIAISAGNGVAGDPTLSLVNDLAALEALAGTGIAVRTALDSWAQRSIVQPASGITIANGDGVAGNPTLALANDLAAIEALDSTGFAVRTAADTWAQRSLVQPGAGMTISASDGVTGNPTFALANDLAALEGLGSTGIAVRTGSDAWAQRTITAGTGITVTNGDGVAGNPSIAFSGTIAGLIAAQTTKTADYTATATDFTIFGNGTFNVFLPAAASHSGRIYAVRNIGAGTVTIDPNASENIDGAATKALAAGDKALIQCDGTQWFTIG